jgi:hypothetical protein
MKKRKPKQFDLSTFDGSLLDGLNFCRRVYDLFNQTRASPDGIAKLRLRPSKNEKRLIEELIPIARYVQARYREGRRIKVRWLSGSQPYDAILLSSGVFVEKGINPRRVTVEVTTAVHQNDYLVRERLHKQGHAFGVKGVSRNKKTGTIDSEPYVVTNGEREADLATLIIDRIKSKGAKGYDPETVLIVYCVPNGITLEDEWVEAVKLVTQADVHHDFREVFLIETSVASYSATLYGDSAHASKHRELPEQKLRRAKIRAA